MPPKMARKTAPGSAQKGKVRKTAAAGDGTPTKKTKGGMQSTVAKTNTNVQRTSYPPPATPTMSALDYSTCAIPIQPTILTIPSRRPNPHRPPSPLQARHRRIERNPPLPTLLRPPHRQTTFRTLSPRSRTRSPPRRRRRRVALAVACHPSSARSR